MRLDHPLLGRDKRLTALGIGYAGIVLIGSVVVGVLHLGLVDRLPAVTIRLIDGYMGGVIIAAVLAMTVIPLLYALANDGPIVAASIALAPHISSIVITQRFVLTNDVVIALVTASLAATMAAIMFAIRRSPSLDAPPTADEVDGLLVAMVVTVIAVWAVIRFDRGAPTSMVATIDPWFWLVVASVVGCLVLIGVFGLRQKNAEVRGASTDSGL